MNSFAQDPPQRGSRESSARTFESGATGSNATDAQLSGAVSSTEPSPVASQSEDSQIAITGQPLNLPRGDQGDGGSAGWWWSLILLPIWLCALLIWRWFHDKSRTDYVTVRVNLSDKGRSLQAQKTARRQTRSTTSRAVVPALKSSDASPSEHSKSIVAKFDPSASHSDGSRLAIDTTSAAGANQTASSRGTEGSGDVPAVESPPAEAQESVASSNGLTATQTGLSAQRQPQESANDSTTSGRRVAPLDRGNQTAPSPGTEESEAVPGGESSPAKVQESAASTQGSTATQNESSAQTQPQETTNESTTSGRVVAPAGTTGKARSEPAERSTAKEAAVQGLFSPQPGDDGATNRSGEAPTQESEFAAMRLAVTTAEQRAVQSEKERDELLDRSKRLEAAGKHLTEELRTAQQTVKAAHAKNKDLETELADLRETERRRQGDSDKLEATSGELESLKLENQSAAERLASRKSELEAATSQLNELQDELLAQDKTNHKLTEELDAAKTQLEQARAEVATLQSKAEAANRDAVSLADTQAHLASVKSELETERSQALALQNELAAAKSELATTAELKSELQLARDAAVVANELQTSFNEIAAELDNANASAVSLKNQADTVRTALAEQQAEAAELKSLLSVAQEETGRLQSAIQVSEQEASANREKLRQAEDRNKQMSDDLNASRAAFSDLETERDQQASEVQGLMAQVQTDTGARRDSEEKLRQELEQQIASGKTLQAEVDSLQAELEELRSSRHQQESDLKKDHDRLTKSLEESRAAAARSGELIALAENKRHDAEQRAKALDEQTASIRKLLEDSQASRKQLEAEVDRAASDSGEVQKLRSEVARLQKLQGDAETEVEVMSETVKSQEAELRRLREQNAEAQQELSVPSAEVARAQKQVTKLTADNDTPATTRPTGKRSPKTQSSKTAPAKKKAAGKKTKAASGKNAKADGDDLTKIEGVGPAINRVFNTAGFLTFADVAAATPTRLNKVLAEAGSRFRMHDAGTWPKQAKLAAEDKWEELASLQDDLHGGRE